MPYPLTFHPVFKERVWGGRDLERLYQKRLPPQVRIGESWEITDRSESVSVVANGPLAGKDLRWLMEHHAGELLGDARSANGRFPILIKILDAREKLSLQVHPPPGLAKELGGEPKTEMWYIAAAQPGAELYAGLRRDVTRAGFECKIRDGTVADCFHRIAVKPGDTMFLPSGRVHAIGAGIVIFEIQQNSDTTYRVFDWNRAGLDGQPRELHVEQSLRSINFKDVEPALTMGKVERNDGTEVRLLADDALFRVRHIRVAAGRQFEIRNPESQILGILEGRLTVAAGAESVQLAPGQFCLKPAVVDRLILTAPTPVSFLEITPGH